MNDLKPDLLELDRTEMGNLLAEWGYSDYHAGLVWQALYRRLVSSLDQMADLRSDLRFKLARETALYLPEPTLIQHSRDGTRKYLLKLSDGESVETVLMPYRDRFTACISTQVGCAMGCVFCATGQMGFVRHLSAGEIVGQVLYLLRVLTQQADLALTDASRVLASKDRRLRNIVFMGMGEPLHNYDATMRAIDILSDHNGLAFAPRHLTLSTVGLVPAIRRLAEERRPVHLAVSLHGSTDDERNRLVPIGRRWPLAELLAACREYSERLGRRVFFEWTLIAGKNDTPEQAHALGELLSDLDAHVNLIPLNPTDSYPEAPSQNAAIARFQEILRLYKIPSTIRQRRGIDIDAGCGQLRARLESAP